MGTGDKLLPGQVIRSRKGKFIAKIDPVNRILTVYYFGYPFWNSSSPLDRVEMTEEGRLVFYELDNSTWWTSSEFTQAYGDYFDLHDNGRFRVFDANGDYLTSIGYDKSK